MLCKPHIFTFVIIDCGYKQQLVVTLDLIEACKTFLCRPYVVLGIKLNII